MGEQFAQPLLNHKRRRRGDFLFSEFYISGADCRFPRDKNHHFSTSPSSWIEMSFSSPFFRRPLISSSSSFLIRHRKTRMAAGSQTRCCWERFAPQAASFPCCTTTTTACPHFWHQILGAHSVGEMWKNIRRPDVIYASADVEAFPQPPPQPGEETVDAAAEKTLN